MTPWPSDITSFPNADVIVVHGVLGLQVDYWDVVSPDSFDTRNCGIWTSPDNGTGLMVCIATSVLNPDHLIAGLNPIFSRHLIFSVEFICPTSIAQAYGCASNTGWQNWVTWNTSMAMTAITSEVVYSRSNSTILAVGNLTQASPVSIAPADLFFVLQQVFSQNIYFLQLVADLLNNFSQAVNGYLAVPYLRAILTLPLLLFQPAGRLNPTIPAPSPYHPLGGLPQDLYASAELSKMNIRGWIPVSTFVPYLIFSLGMYFWCISWLLYTANIPAPPTTPFVLIDFASRVVANGFGFGSLARLLTGTTRGNVQDVREKLADKRVFLGEVVQEVESSDG